MDHNAEGEAERIRRFAGEPFAVLATHGPDDRLDLVPCCFAVIATDGGPEVVSAVDHKPKRHQNLARLANIARDPNVALIADHRDSQDWTNLWWVRVQGRATIVESGPPHQDAVDALVAKYLQYLARPPTGPVIRVRDLRFSGWSPSPPPPPADHSGQAPAP